MRAANNNRRHHPPTEPTSSSSSDNDVDVAIRRELSEMGVDVYEPLSRHEEDLAHSFGRFSDYVLREGGGGRDACLGILEDDLRRGGSSVGELQGGSDEYPIYRASFPPSSSSEGGGGSSGGHSYRGGGARTTRGGGENEQGGEVVAGRREQRGHAAAGSLQPQLRWGQKVVASHIIGNRTIHARHVPQAR